jgi:xanthine dehydrogenase accessory factor
MSFPHVTVLVRGSNDVGSAVAHVLFQAGHRVVLHDEPAPTTARRRMAFTDAVFDGRAELAGVTAERVDRLARLPAALAQRATIPVVLQPFPEVLATLRPDVVVDARMRKRQHPEPQRRLAPLTIGLGPNFVAGDTTDLVVETEWGDSLGTVLARGAARPLAGEPRPIAGHARDRYVYAPVAGVFATARVIGDLVSQGEIVAHIGETALTAPLGGALRGLTRDGVAVGEGTKVLEIDPRGEAAVCDGIGERPARIAAGVRRAVDDWATSGVEATSVSE